MKKEEKKYHHYYCEDCKGKFAGYSNKCPKCGKPCYKDEPIIQLPKKKENLSNY